MRCAHDVGMLGDDRCVPALGDVKGQGSKRVVVGTSSHESCGGRGALDGWTRVAFYVSVFVRYFNSTAPQATA